MLEFWEGLVGDNVAAFNLVGAGTAYTVTGVFISSSIVYIGNGWYRCIATGTRGPAASHQSTFTLGAVIPLTPLIPATVFPALFARRGLIRGMQPTRNKWGFGALGFTNVSGAGQASTGVTGTLSVTRCSHCLLRAMSTLSVPDATLANVTR
jgi:hypothetical protein